MDKIQAAEKRLSRSNGRKDSTSLAMRWHREGRVVPSRFWFRSAVNSRRDLMAESIQDCTSVRTGADNGRKESLFSWQLRRSHNRLRMSGRTVTIMHYLVSLRILGQFEGQTKWQDSVNLVVTPEIASTEFWNRCAKTFSSSRERSVISCRTDRILRKKTPPSLPSTLYTANKISGEHKPHRGTNCSEHE